MYILDVRVSTCHYSVPRLPSTPFFFYHFTTSVFITRTGDDAEEVLYKCSPALVHLSVCYVPSRPVLVRRGI